MSLPRARLLRWLTRFDAPDLAAALARLDREERRQLLRVLEHSPAEERAKRAAERRRVEQLRRQLAGAPDLCQQVAFGSAVEGPPALVEAIRREIEALGEEDRMDGLRSGQARGGVLPWNGEVFRQLWHKYSRMFS